MSSADIKTAIRELKEQGNTPRAIATELYSRGLKSSNGKFLTPDMVEGFLRHRETEIDSHPTVFPEPLKAMEDAAYEGVENSAEEHRYTRGDNREYGHLGPAISEAPYRPGVLKEWPVHTDFRPHETTREERERWD